MLRLSMLISLMTAMPLAAQANTAIHIASSACSDAMSISTLEGASLSCTGNLSLNGGRIDSDSRILIHANGDMLLENLQLTAPEISFSSLSGHIQMASSVNIQTGQLQTTPDGTWPIPQRPIQNVISWSSFNIALNPGVPIQFNTAPHGQEINRVIGNQNGNIYIIGSNGTILLNANGGNLTTAGSITVSNPLSVSSVPEANTGAMVLLGAGLLALRRNASKGRMALPPESRPLEMSLQ